MDYPAFFFDRRVWQVERRRPHPDRIAEAVALLKAAKSPIVIAGGGVIYSDARAELQTFAETFGVPVGETMGGKGAIAGESAMALGGYGVTGTGSSGQLMSQADLVIGVGTRLTDFSTGSQSVFNNPDVKFININVTGQDAYKQGALPIVADAREALRAFVSEANAAEIRPDPAYLEEVGVAKMDWQELLDTEVYVEHPGEATSQMHAINVINQALHPGDTIVAAPAGRPETCTSCGIPAVPATVIWSSASPAWAMRFPAASAYAWRRRMGRSMSWSVTAPT